MFAKAWRRRRAARAMTELTSRAAIRSAEELVGSAWISYLTQRAPSDPVAGQRLEWEQVTIAQASRARAREAARDQRRLAAVRAQSAERAAAVRPVVSRPGEAG